MLKFSAVYLEKRKSFISKKIRAKPYGQNSFFVNQQMAQFWSENFGRYYIIISISWSEEVVIQYEFYAGQSLKALNHKFFANNITLTVPVVVSASTTSSFRFRGLRT